MRGGKKYFHGGSNTLMQYITTHLYWWSSRWSFSISSWSRRFRTWYSVNLDQSSINQSIKEQTNHSINQLSNHSITSTINQSIACAIYQPINQSHRQSTKKSIKQHKIKMWGKLYFWFYERSIFLHLFCSKAYTYSLSFLSYNQNWKVVLFIFMYFFNCLFMHYTILCSYCHRISSGGFG